MLERKVCQVNLLLATLISCTLVTNIAFGGDDDNNSSVRTVNCNKPNASVQKQVDKLKHNREGTIYIIGFCNESVAIVSDGVTLSGNKSGNGTIGGGLAEVTVTGAQRVVIEYLKLTGPGYGVLVQEGASANIRHNKIYDNEADGVGVYNLAFARVEFNRITGNGRLENQEAGIEGGVGANIRSRGNYVADNAYAAVEMGNNGYFRSGLFIPGGGASDPNDRDVFLQKGCSQDQSASACAATAAPDTIAIDCFRDGICDFRNTEVVGNIGISGMSNFDVRTTSINGDVVGTGGSRLQLRSSVRGSGFVSCFTEAFAPSSIGCFSNIPPP
jgi:hypothetical protein